MAGPDLGWPAGGSGGCRRHRSRSRSGCARMARSQRIPRRVAALERISIGHPIPRPRRAGRWRGQLRRRDRDRPRAEWRAPGPAGRPDRREPVRFAVPGRADHSLGLIHAPIAVADSASLWTQRLRYRDLAALGVVPAQWGLATEMLIKGKGPVLDRGFSDAVREGKIEIVAAIAGFDGWSVLDTSGNRLRPDTVIAATGYRAGLEPLVGHLVKLDHWGRPACRDTVVDPDAPGLYFIGYALPLTGQLPEMACTAQEIGRLAKQSASGEKSRAM